MIRFLIEQGYKDREVQGVVSEALGIIYDAKDDLNLETKKDNDTQQDNNNGQSSKEDEDTN